jgi:hypothetical protein
VVKKYFYILLLITSYASAEDSAQVKNQFYLELLGNNFYDFNAYDNVGPVSINYTRKVVLRNNSFLFNAGIGLIGSQAYYQIHNSYYRKINVDIPTGFLWRPSYVKNGFWMGLFFTPIVGEIAYHKDNYGFKSFQKYSFELSPNITYQFQNKSEDLFFRVSLTPKIFASVFSEKFGTRNAFWPFWFGVCLGGGW